MRAEAIANPWGTDPEDFAVPTFLHTTAKCARVIIETQTDHPLEGQQVDIGNPDLTHLGSECNVSIDWTEEGRFEKADAARRQTAEPGARMWLRKATGSLGSRYFGDRRSKTTVLPVAAE